MNGQQKSRRSNLSLHISIVLFIKIPLPKPQSHKYILKHLKAGF